jgi:hypothetical protein
LLVKSGVWDFTHQRTLEGIGVTAVIAAPGKMPRSSSERVKTDRRDKRMPATYLRNGDIETIRVSAEVWMASEFRRGRENELPRPSAELRRVPLVKEMGREMTSVKENPRSTYKAAPCGLILALRPRQLPMNPMSCGSQSAYISLINRRELFSLPFSFSGG